MYPVTTDFIDKMKADRRQVFARVEIDYTDPFMDQSLTIEASEQANVSYPRQTADSVDQTTHKYACLDGTWDLTTGEYHLAPSASMLSQYQMGWWGAQFAGAGGLFVTPYPALTVTHLPRPIRQLKVVGDTAREEYPVDFTIKLYAQDDTLLKTETVTGNTQVSWSKTLEPQVLDVAKQVLEITKWSHAGRCAKIIEFFTSIREVYETGDLVSIRLLEEREASQGSLPVGNISSNEITLALNNEDKKFDVDNEQSPLKNLLKPNRRIQVWLGAEDVIDEWHTEIKQSSYYYQAQLCGGQYVAQGFKPVDSLVGAREVWAYVMSSSAGKEGSPPDVHFHVYSNNEDVPGESISTDYGVVTGDNWPSSRKWVGTKIILDEPLQEGQQYWLVLAGQGVYYYYDNVRYLHSDSDVYADGYRCTSNDGMTWSKTHDRDLAFRLDAPIYKDEWVPLGTFWSLDWDSPDDTLEATVTARDRMELLRKGTYQTAQVLQNKSLYELAEAVLQDAGLMPDEYIIDTTLQNIVVPYSGFNPVSHREALRSIAEAGLAAAFQNRDGKIQIESFLIEDDEPVLEITEDDYFPPLQAPSRQDQVANEIIVDTQPLRPATTSEEVYRSNEPMTIPASTTKTITAFYNKTPVIDAAASLDNPPDGVSITDVSYYGWGASVKIRNTNDTDKQVTLVIQGKPLTVQNKERATARDETSITENGVLRFEFPANPLVQTLDQAQAIANALLASVKDPRRDVEVEWRGNPALLLGDRVTVKGKDYHVIRQEISWAGYMQAKLTGRKAE
ncbi:MAG: hypothetical protein GX387_14265 [Clostridium sp.]|nr:hypothetical protein [Clostridium sp.]